MQALHIVIRPASSWQGALAMWTALLLPLTPPYPVLEMARLTPRQAAINDEDVVRYELIARGPVICVAATPTHYIRREDPAGYPE